MPSRKTTTSKHAQNKNSNVRSMPLQLHYTKKFVVSQIEGTTFNVALDNTIIRKTTKKSRNYAKKRETRKRPSNFAMSSEFPSTFSQACFCRQECGRHPRKHLPNHCLQQVQRSQSQEAVREEQGFRTFSLATET